jgi:cyclophilin family peptidyl-prolyl cis-trans isomerase
MSIKTLTRPILGIIFLVVFSLLLSCGTAESTSSPTPNTAPAPTQTVPPQSSQEAKIMQWNSPPKMEIDVNKKYTATIQTEKGNLVIELFAKDVPITVNNFVFLARQGFYDGSTFHRVIPGFVAQGGDPTGTGGGGPGYMFKNEITSHKHVVGAISMANAGPDTNGCQFFICYTTQPSLDGHYSVFGQLIDGTGVLNILTPRDPTKNPSFTGDKIIKITIKEE